MSGGGGAKAGPVVSALCAHAESGWAQKTCPPYEADVLQIILGDLCGESLIGFDSVSSTINNRLFKPASDGVYRIITEGAGGLA